MNRPIHIVQTTGAADCLTEPTGNRRFWALPQAPLHTFRIRAPGQKPLHALLPNGEAARQLADGLFPNSHPASVVCTSRLHGKARP